MKKKLQKIDFAGKTIYVGMDVHNNNWHSTIIIEEVMLTKAFEPDPQKFYNYLKRNYPKAIYKVVYEAGYCGFWIYKKLIELGVEVLVVNPADIPTTDKETRTKTDKRDSRKLAISLKNGMLNGIYVPSRQAQEDRSLIRLRRTLVKEQTRVKNRIKAYLKFYGVDMPEQFNQKGSHWSRGFIHWLETIEFTTESGNCVLKSHLIQLKNIREELLRVTRQIRQLAKTPKYYDIYKLLISCPGIGMIIAMTLLAEIVTIYRFKHLDQLLSFIGIVPSERSSGDKIRRGHITGRHNRHLRSLIIEASWVAVRKDPALTDFYNSSSIKMKKQKAIIKVARKLVSRIMHVWRNEEEYVYGIAK